jgi:class 3 adenylate cyclase
MAAMNETRKLAAILVADIVGFSRLAGADEDRILARLRTLRSDLIDPIVSVHHGRTVKRTGDGSIVEFRSVVAAVRCAIEIQDGLAQRNAGVPPERRIEFRVGIHLGDVVEEEDGDLMGDGVNIAARLEGVAKPGAICLSEDAYRQVKARLDLKVSDLGPTCLKNIAEPMNVYTIEVGVPAQLAQSEPARRSPPSPPRSAAIGGVRWRPVVLAGALAVGMFIAGAYAPRLYQAYRTVGLTDVSNVQARTPRHAILPSTNLSDDPDRGFPADEIGYSRKGDAFQPTRSSTNDSYFYKNQSTVEEYRVRRRLRSDPRSDSKRSELDADQGTGGSEETYVRRRVNTLAEEMNAGPGMNEPFDPPDLAIPPDRRLPNSPLLRITNYR